MWNLTVTTNMPDDTEIQNDFDFGTLSALIGYIESECANAKASSFVFVIVPPAP
jgi:hypothetical protein